MVGDSWYSFIIDRWRSVSAGIYTFPLYRMILSSFVQLDSADRKGGADFLLKHSVILDANSPDQVANFI